MEAWSTRGAAVCHGIRDAAAGRNAATYLLLESLCILKTIENCNWQKLATCCGTGITSMSLNGFYVAAELFNAFISIQDYKTRMIARLRLTCMAHPTPRSQQLALSIVSASLYDLRGRWVSIM